jgi:hypothetical protein
MPLPCIDEHASGHLATPNNTASSSQDGRLKCSKSRHASRRTPTLKDTNSAMICDICHAKYSVRGSPTDGPARTATYART